MIGGYTVLRYGGGQAGVLRTWGKYIVSSAATFGYLLHELGLTLDSSWYLLIDCISCLLSRVLGR